MRGKSLFLFGALTNIAVLSLAPGASRLALVSGHLSPSPRIELASGILADATHFTGDQAGYLGLVPVEVLAWRVVLQSPEADATFKRILAEGTLAGQMFAMTGLHLTDLPFYTQAATRLRARGGSVEVVDGCIVYDASVDQVLSMIEDGSWTRRFLVPQGGD